MSKIKINSLADLKKWVNKLPDQELSKPLFYNSDTCCVSGSIEKIDKTRADLIYTGEDDPASLYTRSELKNNGHSKEDIEMMDVEIPRGSYVLNF